MATEQTDRSILDISTEKDAHVAERLHKDIIIWLSTVRPDGRPHLVPVWYVWDGKNTILIFSKPDQKIKNIGHNPNVALALESSEGDDVVMLEGTATLLEPGSTNTRLASYAEKYSRKLKEMNWTAESMAPTYSQPISIALKKVRAW